MARHQISGQKTVNGQPVQNTVSFDLEARTILDCIGNELHIGLPDGRVIVITFVDEEASATAYMTLEALLAALP